MIFRVKPLDEILLLTPSATSSQHSITELPFGPRAVIVSDSQGRVASSSTSKAVAVERRVPNRFGMKNGVMKYGEDSESEEDSALEKENSSMIPWIFAYSINEFHEDNNTHFTVLVCGIKILSHSLKADREAK